MAKDYQTYNMFDFITDESFKKWVLEPTSESNYFWQSWIDNHPEKMVEVTRAREFILSIKFQNYGADSTKKEAIYNRVMQRSRQESVKRHAQDRVFWGRKASIIKIAASILVLITLCISIHILSDKTNVEPPKNEVMIFKSKTTGRGERLTLMLPDGSLVKLNAESYLRYPATFGSRREVSLRGEAYFEVERDTLKPFIVKTGEVTTEVLGTRFNVNYSAGDSIVQVAVTSGKVAVSTGYDQKSYLLPTEVLTCKPQGIKKGYFDEEHLLGWKDGILAFENANLTEIIKRLSVWYDVDFVVLGKKTTTRKYSGKFKNKSLRYVLNGISFSSEFEFKIDQNKVIINLK